jgi:hypothetical protein
VRAIPCTLPCQGFHFPTIRALPHPFELALPSPCPRLFCAETLGQLWSMGTQASKKSLGVAFQSQETIRERAAREGCQVPALKARGEIGELQTPGAWARFSTLRVQVRPARSLGPSCVSHRAAQTRIVSGGPSWPSRGRVITHLKYMADARILEIAVGTLITERPPHRTERAPFGHSAPTSGI